MARLCSHGIVPAISGAAIPLTVRFQPVLFDFFRMWCTNWTEICLVYAFDIFSHFFIFIFMVQEAKNDQVQLWVDETFNV
jgi:hypothetical protein